MKKFIIVVLVSMFSLFSMSAFSMSAISSGCTKSSNPRHCFNKLIDATVKDTQTLLVKFNKSTAPTDADRKRVSELIDESNKAVKDCDTMDCVFDDRFTLYERIYTTFKQSINIQEYNNRNRIEKNNTSSKKFIEDRKILVDLYIKAYTSWIASNPIGSIVSPIEENSDYIIANKELTNYKFPDGSGLSDAVQYTIINEAQEIIQKNLNVYLPTSRMFIRKN